MALESNIEDPGVYINSLNDANPAYTDGLSQADDHIRGIKNCILNTFANITGAVTSTHTELNLLTGKSLSSSDDVIDNFPSGTLLLFQQTAAPTGWTKQTTHNDKALRVVSGAASSGGSVAFSTVFARTATDGHALSIAEMPAHNHPGTVTGSSYASNVGGSDYDSSGSPNSAFLNTVSVASQGGGGAHTHNIDIRVQYVDLIIASKD